MKMSQWNYIPKLNDNVTNVLSSVPFKTSYCSGYFDGELETIGDDYVDVYVQLYFLWIYDRILKWQKRCTPRLQLYIYIYIIWNDLNRYDMAETNIFQLKNFAYSFHRSWNCFLQMSIYAYVVDLTDHGLINTSWYYVRINLSSQCSHISIAYVLHWVFNLVERVQNTS